MFSTFNGVFNTVSHCFIMFRVSEILNNLVLYKIFGIPFIVLLVTLSSVFLTLRFRAINLYGLFKIKKVKDKILKKEILKEN